MPGLVDWLEPVEAHTGRRQVRKGRSLRRRPGRPKAETSHRKADGERVQAALNLLGYKSQAAAAAQAGMKAATLNGIINGKRGIGPADLRSLAKIGIPGDFIYGYETKLLPPGQTRTPGKLAEDLAVAVKRDVLTPTVIPEEWLREVVSSSIDGEVLLSLVTDSVREEIQVLAEAFRKMSDAGIVYRRIEDEDLRKRVSATIGKSWIPTTRHVAPTSQTFQKLAQHIVGQDKPKRARRG